MSTSLEVDREPRARREAWTWGAWSLLALEVAGVVYLALRLEGRGPVLVYYAGPPLLGLGALLVAATGIVTAVRRRPLLRPGRLSAFAVLAVVVGTSSYPLPFPARREQRPSRVELRLPLHGTWHVLWGGADTARNLLARTRPDRRFGYDLVLRREGRAHEGDGARLEQWYAFGEPVHAPCAGTVVRVVDAHEDRAPTHSGPLEEELGNHVVLEIAADEFLFLSHLRRGSLTVEVGDAVAPGDLLGEVGRSGDARATAEPHLALHLQDVPEPRWGQGIPFAFHGVLVNDQPRARALPVGRPIGAASGALGDRLRNADG